MVQPHMLELDGIGVDAQIVPDAALDMDGHVAQPDGPVPVVHQGLGDDADGIGEVDHPGAGGGPFRGLLGDLEDEGDGAQGLGQPAGAGGLLAEAAVADGQGLVGVAGRLPSDPELDDDEVGTVDGPVPIVGGDQLPGPAPLAQDPTGQATDRLQPVRVRVEQDQLVDDQPVLVAAQAVDELRRVRAPAADDGHLRSHTSNVTSPHDRRPGSR